jgi:transposase
VQTLVRKRPEHLIGDAAYESDQLDAELAQRGIELNAPHRSDRKRKTQDGRPLRQYRRRWKVERLFAWLQNYRRIVLRYERHSENFLCYTSLVASSCCGVYEMISSSSRTSSRL